MEKIIIKVIVDGEELHPIAMGKGEEDDIYKDDIAFFSMGEALTKREH